MRSVFPQAHTWSVYNELTEPQDSQKLISTMPLETGMFTLSAQLAIQENWQLQMLLKKSHVSRLQSYILTGEGRVWYLQEYLFCKHKIQ
jgi:hypothetical protein